MKKWLFKSLLGFILCLESCKVGPNYFPPDPCVPDEWHSELTVDGDLPEQWWEVFEDPLLDKYMGLGAGNNPSVLAAQSHLLQARALKQVVASSLFPQINADINGSRTYFSKNGPLFFLSPGTGTGFTAQIPQLQNLFNATLDAAWEIDLFGKTLRGVEQAEARIGAAAAQKDDVLISIFAEIARNYFEIRSAQMKGRLIDQNITLLEKTAAIAKKRYEKGLINLLDYERTQAELSVARAALPPLVAQIYQGIYALSVLVGEFPEALLCEMLPDKDLPQVPEGLSIGLRSDVLRRRPDVRQAERELAAATAQVGISIASFFPTFSLTSDIGFQSLAFSKLFIGKSKTWAYGADINLPLFSGGALVGNFHAAEWGANEAAWNYQNALLAALQDTESALVAYEQDFKAFALYQDSTARTLKVYSLSSERYNKGLINLTDLFDSERQYLSSALNQVSSQTSTLIDLVRLYKALGGGWQPYISYPE